VASSTFESPRDDKEPSLPPDIAAFLKARSRSVMKHHKHEKELSKMRKVPFDHFKARPANLFGVKSIPHDKRFEIIEGNYKYLSRKLEAGGEVPDFKRYDQRKDLFAKESYFIDYEPKQASKKCYFANFKSLKEREPLGSK